MPAPYRPITVCMLTNSVYARDVRVRRYSEYLANDGHRVDIISLAAENGEKSSSHPNIRVFPLAFTRKRKERFAAISEWLRTTAAMTLKMTRLATHTRYDLIHVHNMPDFLVFAATLPKLRGAETILNIHDPTPEITESKLQVSAAHPLVRAQIIMERLCVLFADAVITATPAFKRLLVERNIPASKIFVVTNAANESLFPLADAESLSVRDANGAFTLLYVGTVAERYGLQTAISALPRIRERIPHIRLEIYTKVVNEGHALEDCLVLGRTLGVSDLIRRHEPAPLENMAQIMRSADLGIYPALRDCHMDTALSLKIPEMANVGLPILSSRLTVLEELYGDDAIAFVPAGDVEAFAEKVIQLHDRPDYRLLLAKNALKRAAAFDWATQYRIYIDLLEQLLGRRLQKG